MKNAVRRPYTVSKMTSARTLREMQINWTKVIAEAAAAKAAQLQAQAKG